jgi:hypothetical protein
MRGVLTLVQREIKLKCIGVAHKYVKLSSIMVRCSIFLDVKKINNGRSRWRHLKTVVDLLISNNFELFCSSYEIELGEGD